MPTGQPFRAVQAVLEVPHDSVSELETVSLEAVVKDDVERENLTALNVVAYLPANRPLWMQQPHALRDRLRLSFHILLQRRSGFVRLPDVIWRRRGDELHAFAAQPAHEGQVVRAGHSGLGAILRTDAGGNLKGQLLCRSCPGCS